MITKGFTEGATNSSLDKGDDHDDEDGDYVGKDDEDDLRKV